jgi:hypothetical protein
MNPELKSILQQVNDHDMFEMQGSQLITEDAQNDLLNQKTIGHYIGQAFSIIDLEKGMAEFRKKQ